MLCRYINPILLQKNSKTFSKSINGKKKMETLLNCGVYSVKNISNHNVNTFINTLFEQTIFLSTTKLKNRKKI